MKTLKKNSEHAIQKECVQWFRRTFPEGLIWSTPNEAAFSRWSHFEESGALRGVPDVTVVLHGLVFFVEFKTEVGSQSDAQLSIEHKLTLLDQKYYIIRSLEAFQALFV